mmetsp:Transcript_45631/g.146440  ORF Transcript_45631/g.146440 Transcript_45631/m.146440 type:complete len:523 (-) Transcript_45631:120-1688(-)
MGNSLAAFAAAPAMSAAVQTPPRAEALLQLPPQLAWQRSCRSSASASSSSGCGGRSAAPVQSLSSSVALWGVACAAAGLHARRREERARIKRGRLPRSAFAAAPAPVTLAYGAKSLFDAMPKLWLQKDVRKAMREEKHPWIYDRALHQMKEEPASGAMVGVVFKKDFIAVGFYDPASPLRVRLLTWGYELPDERWAARVAAEAADRRRKDKSLQRCSGIRLLNGETDWMPGLVMDAYNGIVVVACDGDACEAFWLPKLNAILRAFIAAGFGLTCAVRKGSGEPLWFVDSKADPPGVSVFEENGAKFEADVANGHKTGFFLDQRENRRSIRGLASGKEVLDLFCYTGGFAISAALGGATRTTSVDQAAKAIEVCQRNFKLNGFDAEIVQGSKAQSGTAHSLHVGDCFDFLEEAAARGRLFDVVVCDPPSMAPSEKTRGRALNAYDKLNALSLAVVRKGGLLLSCSCSSHVHAKDLRKVVLGAAEQAGRKFTIEREDRAGSDHPLRKGFPQGDYLQALYVRVHD